MTSHKRNRGSEIALWALQLLLTALFLFAGSMKLAASADALAQQSPLPIAFLRFIGVAEVLGALGLVLPALFGVRRGLTALAAAGLTIIMVGATAISAAGGLVAALIPGIVGVCCAVVAYCRKPAETRTPALHSAN